MQSIRAFADERNATTAPAHSEKFGEMKTIFAAMRLEGDIAGGASGIPDGDIELTSGSNQGLWTHRV